MTNPLKNENKEFASLINEGFKPQRKINLSEKVVLKWVNSENTTEMIVHLLRQIIRKNVPFDASNTPVENVFLESLELIYDNLKVAKAQDMEIVEKEIVCRFCDVYAFIFVMNAIIYDYFVDGEGNNPLDKYKANIETYLRGMFKKWVTFEQSI